MFKKITISLFASSLGIQSDNNNCILGASIDSRQISIGDVFFALKGSFEEVESYIKTALSNGAILVISKYHFNLNNTFQVNDVLFSLNKLALLNRSYFKGHMIALTGSNGKTTVKNLIFHMLNCIRPGTVFATIGNFNNHLGVPLSLCKLNENHKFAILEVGANHLGEISSLSSLIKPNTALITSISNSHLGEFGDLGNIFKAKSEIIYSLNNLNSQLFISSKLLEDNFFTIKNLAENHLKNIYISEDILTINKIFFKNNYNQIEFDYNNQIFQVTFSLLGIHNAYNLRLALSVVLKLTNIDAHFLFKNLDGFINNQGRGQIYDIANGNIIVDESYNANPSSVKALIDILSCFDKKKILVLGDMNELGEFSLDLHKDIGFYSRGKIDKIFAFGDLAKCVQEEFSNTFVFDDLNHIFQEIQKEQNIVIGIKGSRTNKLELLVQKLINKNN